METEKSSKKSKIMVVVIVILSLVILGLVLYICYDKGVIFQNTEKEAKESSVKLNKKVKEDKKENTEIKELDLSKPINTSDISYSNSNPASSSDDELGLTLNIGTDSKTATLSIDWNKFGPFSGASAWAPTVQNYPITGFSKNIDNLFIGTLGQDATGATLFYLMSDGTVEYTPMFNSQLAVNYAYYNGDNTAGFETKGVVNGVSDVIKLYNVSASAELTSGWATTIAAKADGSFYDLGNIISK